MLILKLCLLRYLLLGQLFFAGLAVYFYRCKREMPLAPVYSLLPGSTDNMGVQTNLL